MSDRITPTINSETLAPYFTTAAREAHKRARASEDAVLERAREILANRLRANVERANGTRFTSPQIVTEFLALRLAELEHEQFHVMYLTSQHQLIECVHHFSGTLDSASVYPREIVKAALQHNAGAVILAHNHPGGTTEPSQADRKITGRLKEALELIGVRTLDHVIVSSTGETYSFAERGDI